MPNSIDEPHDKWLTQLVETYQHLPSYRKINVLESLIRVTDSEFLAYLYDAVLPRYVYRDFVSDLPLEISTKVLSYLDGCDLLKSCKVNRTWDSIINGCSSLWKNICDLYGAFSPSTQSLPGELVDYGDDDKRTHLRDIPANFQCLEHYFLNESDISDAIQPASADSYKRMFCEFLAFIHRLKPRRKFNNRPVIMHKRGHQATVTCCYHFGNQLATGDRVGMVRFWNVKTLECMHMFDCSASISCLTFDHSLLIIGSYTGSLKSWKRTNDKPHLTFDGDFFSIKSVELSRTKSPMVISISFQYIIKLWCCCTGNCLFVSDSLMLEKDFGLNMLVLKIVADISVDAIFVITIYTSQKRSIVKIVFRDDAYQDVIETSMRNQNDGLCLWTGTCFQLFLRDNRTISIKDRRKTLWCCELPDFSGLTASRWPILCFGGNHFLNGYRGLHDMFLATNHGPDVVFLKFKFYIT